MGHYWCELTMAKRTAIQAPQFVIFATTTFRPISLLDRLVNMLEQSVPIMKHIPILNIYLVINEP